MKAANARIAELEGQRKQDLARLSSGEEARRELERLQEERSRAFQPPTGYDPAAQQAQEAFRVWQELQETSPAAAQAIAATVQMTQQEIQKSRAEQRWYRELDQVPAPDRPAVEKRARELNVSPAWAHDKIKSERWDSESAKVQEQSRKLQEEQDRLRRGTVNTVAAPAPPASPNATEISLDEWRRLARAAAQGDVEARKRVTDYDEGRLKIRPG